MSAKKLLNRDDSYQDQIHHSSCVGFVGSLVKVFVEVIQELHKISNIVFLLSTTEMIL